MLLEYLIPLLPGQPTFHYNLILTSNSQLISTKGDDNRSGHTDFIRVGTTRDEIFGVVKGVIPWLGKPWMGGHSFFGSALATYTFLGIVAILMALE